MKRIYITPMLCVLTDRFGAEIRDAALENGSIAGTDGDVARRRKEHGPWRIDG